MTKKKTAAAVTLIIIISAAVFCIFYFLILKKDGGLSEYDKIREGMKIWADSTAPGISVYVPEDYTDTKSEYYTVYTKDDARVSLTWEAVSNDLPNYAAYALKQYENITDSFSIREEYDEELMNTTVHVVEFNYSLALSEGTKYFACLAAFVMGEGKAYVLTCTASPENYPLYSEDFHRIYKTMCLTDKNDGT